MPHEWRTDDFDDTYGMDHARLEIRRTDPDVPVYSAELESLLLAGWTGRKGEFLSDGGCKCSGSYSTTRAEEKTLDGLEYEARVGAEVFKRTAQLQVELLALQDNFDELKTNGKQPADDHDFSSDGWMSDAEKEALNDRVISWETQANGLIKYIGRMAWKEKHEHPERPGILCKDPKNPGDAIEFVKEHFDWAELERVALQGDVENLQDNVQDLQDHKHVLEKQVENFEDHVQRLQEHEQELEEQLQDLKSQQSAVTRMAARIAELEEHISILNTSNLEYRGRNQALTGKFRSIVLFKPRKDDNFGAAPWKITSTDTFDHISCTKEGPEREYNVDKVLMRDLNDEVFPDVRVQIGYFLNGHDGCIMAYGGSGSGKTHTMMNPWQNTGGQLAQTLPQHIGVVPKAVDFMANHIRSSFATKRYTVHVSVVEVYLGKVYDLLRNGAEYRQEVKSEFVKDAVRGDYRTPFWAQGAMQLSVASPGQELNFNAIQTGLQLAVARRKVRSTSLNETSSRSHLVISMHASVQDVQTGQTQKSVMNFVDLAGNEPFQATQGDYTAADEGKSINADLTALITALHKTTEPGAKASFKDRKLTQVLEQTMRKDCLVTLLVTVSPEDEEPDFTRTVRSLEKANDAANIKARIKIPGKSTPPAGPVADIKAERSPGRRGSVGTVVSTASSTRLKQVGSAVMDGVKDTTRRLSGFGNQLRGQLGRRRTFKDQDTASLDSGASGSINIPAPKEKTAQKLLQPSPWAGGQKRTQPNTPLKTSTPPKPSPPKPSPPKPKTPQHKKPAVTPAAWLKGSATTSGSPPSPGPGSPASPSFADESTLLSPETANTSALFSPGNTFSPDTPFSPNTPTTPTSAVGADFPVTPASHIPKGKGKEPETLK